MNLGRRLRFLLIPLFGASLLLTLVALFIADRGSFSKLQELTDRLVKSDKEHQQSSISAAVQEPLSLMADQITERRDDLIESVQQLASDGALRALYASAHPALGATKVSLVAKPETLQQILARWSVAKKGVWESADLTDKAGRVLASWPVNPPAGADISKEAIFAQLSASGAPLGISAFEFVKKSASASQLVLACGIEGADGNFAGLLRVKISVNKLFGLRLEDFLKSLKSISPKAILILTRGSGEEVFHSSKGSYAESFDGLGQDFKSAKIAMQAQSEGKAAVQSYDGKPALLVWKRVGAWQPGAGVSSLLTLVSLLPEDDFKAAAGAVTFKKPAPFWARPMILLLLMLAFAAPLLAGWMLFKRELEPLSRMVEVASQIDEQGRLPEGVEFQQETNPEINHVNLNFNFLISQSNTASERLAELERSLSRAEEQAGRDATITAQELADLRTRLSVTETNKTSLQGALDGAEGARREATAQASGLKQELESFKADAGIKSIENKKLLSQIQDLTQQLEELSKKSMTSESALFEAQKVSLREEEMVRLSAVNTLSVELKATLLIIKNYVSSMLGSSEAISGPQQEFLGVVINKSARLERLIGDLVELSEIASGSNPLQLETTRLALLLEESSLQVKSQADQKNITLDITGLESGAEVLADKEKLGAVIRALLVQAIKVTARGEHVSAAISADAHNCELRVTDSGMGLTPDRAVKVFNQFHGLDSQAGPEFIGTGLRFSILRAVLEAQGGGIRIESTSGRGKGFVVTLPVTGIADFKNLAKVQDLMAPGMVLKPLPTDFAGFNSIFGEMPSDKTLPALPSLPALGIPGGAAPAKSAEEPKAILKEEDKAGFDAIFGTPPLPAKGKNALPVVEFKTEVAKKPLDENELANFASIFGDAPILKPGIPEELAKFDAIFGDTAKSKIETSPAPGSSGLDDLNNMFK